MIPSPAKPIHYAIYTRQSVEKPDTFSLCDAQFMTCRDFAKAAGERHQRWIGYRIDDDGYSSATLDRPGICPICRRLLSPYIITKQLDKHAGRAYRYYRCCSTAAGRWPCKGIQFSAWDMEQVVRDICLPT